MADRGIKERRRIRELEAVFRFYWGPKLPDDDAGRDALRLLADHLVHLSDGRTRFLNFAETRADWMPALDLYEIYEAAARVPRRWSAEALGRELNLTFDYRTQLGITMIAASDRTRAEVKALQAERKNERQRLKRLKERQRAKPPVAADPFTARQRSLLNTLAAGQGWQTVADLKNQVAALACWRDRIGGTLAPESLRRLINRELDALVSASAVEEGERVQTKFDTKARRVRFPASGSAQVLVPVSRRPGSVEKVP